MSIRQSMWFFTGSTIKTVDDHCGYAFPLDPLQFITSNNALYHDIHHQSWGIKTNFSQPFFTFWDKLLGTMWTGGDVTHKYECARKAAEKKAEINVLKPNFLPSELQPSSASASEPTSEVESAKEQPQPALRRSPRKKDPSASQQTANLKGLRDRVNSNLQGKSPNVLGVESSH